MYICMFARLAAGGGRHDDATKYLLYEVAIFKNLCELFC